MGLDPDDSGSRAAHASAAAAPTLPGDDDAVAVQSRRVSPFRRLLRSPNGAIGFTIVIFWVAVATVGPYFTPHSPSALNISAQLAGSSGEHLLGTDQYGRDVLSRIVAGSRYTVLVALTAAAISLIVGGVL